MKKHSVIIALIIILGTAGFVFYTGWTQFKVPQGKTAVVVSKLTGTDNTPVTHDRFSWHWEFLIPNNASLRIFETKPYSEETVITGELPSAKAYARATGENVSFDYSFSFEASLKVSPENITALVKDNDLSGQKELDEKLKAQAEALSRKASVLLIGELLEQDIDAVIDMDSISEKAVNKALEQGLKVLPQAELVSFSVKSWNLPDISLYLKARNYYEEYHRLVQANIDAQAKNEAQDSVRFNSTLEKLEKLGELLKKYPDLAEIIKTSDNINSTLTAIDSIR